MAQELFGNDYVTPTPTAIARAWKLCKGSIRDYQILRRHGLKLAHWPSGENAPRATLMDLDWDWVEGLQEHRIGELRIDDVIAGHENLRIIFFKANTVLPGDPLPRIWPMTVFAKKRQGFTANEIQAWRAMKRLLVSRKYQDFPTA